jgi:hypothetical protein
MTDRKPRRDRLPTVLLCLASVAVAVVLVVAWRPWADGAQGRLTSSGLVPVLALLVGQLGATAISARSAAQALEIRALELEHDRQTAIAAASRADAERSAAAAAAQTEAVLERLVEAIRATAALTAALKTKTSPKPTAEVTAAQVALLRLIPIVDRAGDSRVALSVNDALEGISDYMAKLAESATYWVRVNSLMTRLDATAREIATSELMR